MCTSLGTQFEERTLKVGQMGGEAKIDFFVLNQDLCEVNWQETYKQTI